MTDLPIVHLLGILALIAELVVISTAFALLFRLWRRGELQKGLAQIVFLEDRRRRFARLFGLLSVVLLGLGLVGSLSALNILSYTELQTIDPSLFILGVITLFAILLYGLRPTKLTESDEETLRAAPQALFSMGLIPILIRAEEDDRYQTSRR